jgi:hypothetical protein
VGSSYNRLSPAEDNKEALLSGYPPVLRLRSLADTDKSKLMQSLTSP